jgi:hypothetical protein
VLSGQLKAGGIFGAFEVKFEEKLETSQLFEVSVET